ncbi:MAG TPA: fumarylacetoacetate hydrolase family protein [Blastocatellia bacterium]|nr:fumarylacetoacetate hydrolase family protein [Blastocatellia bacterium]
MKLASYLWNGRKHIGFFDGDRLYSLTIAAENPGSGMKPIADMTDFLSQSGRTMQMVRPPLQIPKEASCALTDVKLLPPVTNPEKIICIGRNYADHAKETGSDLPPEPLFFTKFNSALAGANDPVILPRISQQVDYEAELAFVIGREGKNISYDNALDHVAGYMVFNDVSARDWQFRTGQFTAGKTFDTFASCGPFLVTADEVGDPHNLSIKLTLNGQVMQDSSTSHLIFNIPKLVEYLSQLFPLKPGDIVSTGTPSGVGFARKPPVFLKDGDKVKIEIERVGVLESIINAEN